MSSLEAAPKRRICVKVIYWEQDPRKTGERGMWGQDWKEAKQGVHPAKSTEGDCGTVLQEALGTLGVTLPQSSSRSRALH